MIVEGLLDFFRWIWITSIMGGVLAVLILLVKKIWKDKLSAAWHYWIWMLLIVRLLLPWSPESMISIYNWLPVDTYVHDRQDVKFTLGGVIHRQSEGVVEGKVWNGHGETWSKDAGFGEGSPPLTEPFGWFSFFEDWFFSAPGYHGIFLIWIIGVFFFGIILCWMNFKVFLRVKKAGPVTDSQSIRLLEHSCESMNITSKIRLLKVADLATPTLFGIFRPRILLSGQILAALGENELRHVFLHELAHFKRKDIPVNCLMTGLLILHWFNPVLWYAYYRMRVDQEIACDALALSYLGRKEANAYGHTMIKLLEHFSRGSVLPGMAHFMGGKANLRQRIAMIKSFGVPPRRWSLLGLCLLLLLGCTTLTNGKSSLPVEEGKGSAPTQKDQREQAVWQHLQGSSSKETETHAVEAGMGSASSPQELIREIVYWAKKGTVKGSETFTAEDGKMEQVRKAWGEPNSVSKAGYGLYATFAKREIVFGYHPSGAIFDVRSYSKSYHRITYSQVKEAMGEPDELRFYQDENYDQHILVYQVNDQFQLKWVFPRPTKDEPDPPLHHITVFHAERASI